MIEQQQRYGFTDRHEAERLCEVLRDLGCNPNISNHEHYIVNFSGSRLHIVTVNSEYWTTMVYLEMPPASAWNKHLL